MGGNGGVDWSMGLVASRFEPCSFKSPMDLRFSAAKCAVGGGFNGALNITSAAFHTCNRLRPACKLG